MLHATPNISILIYLIIKSSFGSVSPWSHLICSPIKSKLYFLIVLLLTSGNLSYAESCMYQTAHTASNKWRSILSLLIEEKQNTNLGSATTDDQEVLKILHSVITFRGTICFQETLSRAVFNKALFNKNKGHCIPSQSNFVYYAVNLY
jgi:hypothetical protein